VCISAAQQIGIDQLLAAIDEHMEIDALRPMRIRVPQTQGKLLAQIEARARIVKRSYRDAAVEMELEAPESLARSLEAYVVPRRGNLEIARDRRHRASSPSSGDSQRSTGRKEI
jgi:GTP-binding protein HflX